MASPKNPARGTELPHARLNPESVKKIRENRKGETRAAMAARFGVHINTIDKVRRHESWGHVCASS